MCTKHLLIWVLSGTEKLPGENPGWPDRYGVFGNRAYPVLDGKAVGLYNR